MDEDILRDYYQTMRELMEWRGKTTASLAAITEELEHIRSDLIAVRSDISILCSDVTIIDKKCIQHLSQTGQITKEIAAFKQIDERLNIIEKKIAESAAETRINREAMDKRYKRLTIIISIFAVIAPSAIAVILNVF